MTSSADLPEGFLAEVFRNGCQCDHCVKWRAEVERLQQENADLIYTNREQAGMIEGAGVTIVKLREAIKRWSIAVKTTPLKSTMEQETECFQAARDLHEIAREGR